ncbi:MAG: pitrilysin family protein [Balneolaceae bacterium]
MKKLRIFILLLLAGCASTDSVHKNWDNIEYPEINNFEQPDVEVFTIDNGITFYLMEDHELPLINMSVRVRTGSFLEPEDKTGLASVTGSVMRSGGSETYPDDELNELLENRAAHMETNIGLTSGSASMNVLREDFENLLPVFVDLLSNPAFPEDKIDLAKTQTETSISRRNDDQGAIANREFRRLIYGPNSVYGRLTEYETIQNITREDLVNFHEQSFVAPNMMVGIVGDFDSDEIKQNLEEAFSSIPEGEKRQLNFPEVDYDFTQGINFINKSDVNQSYVLLGHIGGMRDNPDYAKLQVMNQVLSGGFSSRLFQVVRSDLGLAYAVFGSYGSNNFYPGTFTAGVMTQSETTAEAIDAIFAEIERLQEEPVSEEELQHTKDQFLNSLVFRYDSRAKILNERLANEYAGLDPDIFDRLVEEVIEVTPEDVSEAAREYLRPDAMKILVVGNASEIGDQLEKYGEVNEIDISIPEPGEGDQPEGDAEEGRVWIGKMANALLPDGPFQGDLIFEADNLLQTPQGEMAIGLRQTYNFQNEKLISEVSMAMGQVIMQIEEGEGKMLMGGNEMPMQPQQMQQLRSELHRNYIYLALNRETLDVEYLGMAEVDGVTYAHLRINGEMPLNLYLDQETSLPAITTYREVNPQAGGRVSVKVVAGDWRENNGVQMAYESVSYADDEEIAKTTLKSHSVE